MAYTFPMQHQEEPDWCWAAVAVSVERYFDPRSKLTQAELAQKVLGPPCSQGGACDVPFYLDRALKYVQRLRRTLPQQLTFQDIQQELNNNLPVCARIAWNGGGAHFVVLCGFGVSSAGIAQLFVSDPILQDSNVVTWDYNAFIGNYSDGFGGEGQWVDSYLLNP